MTYADSSFLVSLYVTDGNTPTAGRFLVQNPNVIHLTIFTKTEVQHAIRLLAFTRAIQQDMMARSLLNFERDHQEGIYEIVPTTGESIFQKTAQLSNRHALDSGVRYLDMVHIAAAQLIGATRFLTFDARQAKLARALGLQVKP